MPFTFKEPLLNVSADDNAAPRLCEKIALAASGAIFLTIGSFSVRILEVESDPPDRVAVAGWIRN